ncbi:MAG: hypothetical protein ACK4IK_03375 [Bacteroidia bacterium]
MKNIIIAVIALSALTFTSCRKCVTCYYKYKTGGNWDVYMYPEECGKKKDLERFRNECKAEAATRNTTCTCNDNSSTTEG